MQNILNGKGWTPRRTHQSPNNYDVRRLISMTCSLCIYQGMNRYTGSRKKSGKAQLIDVFFGIHGSHETTKIKGGRSTRLAMPNSIQLGTGSHLLCPPRTHPRKRQTVSAPYRRPEHHSLAPPFTTIFLDAGIYIFIYLQSFLLSSSCSASWISTWVPSSLVSLPAM